MLKWLFIVGPPRTASTVLSQALSLHPQCTVLNESGFPHRIMDAAASKTVASVYFRQYDTDALVWSERTKFEWFGDDPVRGCIEFRSLFGERQIFGDKLPGAIFHWRKIDSMLENSFFVVTTRDKDEIIASCERRASRDLEFAELYAKHGQHRIDAAVRESVLIEQERGALRVDHAVLHADPQAAITSVLSYVGLDIGEYPFNTMKSVYFDKELHRF